MVEGLAGRRLSAREAILGRIRAIPVPAAPGEEIRRPVHASALRPHEEVVEQFAEYAAEYKAHVVRVGAVGLPEAIREALAARGSERVVIPADLPSSWFPSDLSLTVDKNLDHAALDLIQAVVTGCAVAVAETGTVVLDAGPGQGRRAISLIPDHHVCVVFAHQIVDSVPEAVSKLSESVSAGYPLTWISGPSATSDIELNRVEGVHGPRVLDIVIVD